MQRWRVRACPPFTKVYAENENERVTVDAALEGPGKYKEGSKRRGRARREGLDVYLLANMPTFIFDSYYYVRKFHQVQHRAVYAISHPHGHMDTKPNRDIIT